MSDNKTWIKAYKGFDKDLKCRGRQYTDGVEDHVSDVARLCKEGVHACERPLDVFRYYVPADSVYHEVELAGVLDEHKEDSKICGTDIKVKGKLDIAGLVKAQIEYTKSHCTNKYNAGARGAASAGYGGAATSRGKSSVGENGIACSRSDNARVKGDMGAVLVCAKENEYNYDIKTWAAGVVDGVNILSDVWYKAENGRLVPADD